MKIVYCDIDETGNVDTDMLNQMKGVRQKPNSVSNVGSSQAPEKSPDDKIFESLLGSESGIERLM